MSRRLDLALAVLVIGAFGTIAVLGHADARLDGVSATVTNTTCTDGNVSAFDLRVTNERPEPVTFAVGLRTRTFGDPTFWRTAAGELRRQAKPESTTEIRLSAPGPNRRLRLFEGEVGTADRAIVVMTLHTEQERLDVRSWFGCNGWEPYRR